MSKIAFIYPGQGAQKCGMGRDFYENSEQAERYFDDVCGQLDFDLKKICFTENLMQHRNVITFNYCSL